MGVRKECNETIDLGIRFVEVVTVLNIKECMLIIILL